MTEYYGSRDHGDLYRRGTNAPAGGMIALGGVLAVIGTVFFVLMYLGDDPGRAWRIYHVNFLFFSGISIGGVVFAATQKVTKGRWAGPIIRFAEAGSAFLPVSLILFLLLFLGRHYLFPWIEEPTPLRGNWLTASWVFWRDLVSLVVVFGLALVFVYYDIRPDAAVLQDEVSGWRKKVYRWLAGDYSGTPEQIESNEKRIHVMAPILLLLYAYLFSLIGFDLIMSLAPYWLSNLFGAFFFIGAFLTGLTTLGLMMVYWRSKLGMHQLVMKETFHDLGKLVFAFTVFWAYLTYSQVLVIWYGNLPEETSFVFWRFWSEWRTMTFLVGILVFVVPFWGLIWIKAKVTPFTFVLFVTVSLIGIWLERFVLVQPSLTEHGPEIGLPEVGVTLGFLGLFLLAYGLFARAVPMVSPRLSERSLLTGHH